MSTKPIITIMYVSVVIIPLLSGNAVIKLTKTDLKLLTNINILHFYENGTWGRIKRVI